MSKPGGDPSSGISSGDALILPERHPACRRREAQPGSCTERENLSLRCQGRRPSGSHRKDQSTEAEHLGGAAQRQRVEANEVCTTLRWREMDSNPRSPRRNKVRSRAHIPVQTAGTGIQLPLRRKQFPPPERRRRSREGEPPRELDLL